MVLIHPVFDFFDTREEHGAVPEQPHQVKVSQGLRALRQHKVFCPAVVRLPGEEAVFPLPGHESQAESSVLQGGHIQRIAQCWKGKLLLHIAALCHRCLRHDRLLFSAPSQTGEYQSQGEQNCQ